MNDKNEPTDEFERRLAAQMRAATEGLEPTLRIDELTLASPARSHTRTWVRVAASGLVAAAVIGALVVGTTRSSDPSSVSSPDSTDQVIESTTPPTTAAGVTTTVSAAASTARNFLVVGTDNGSCTDSASPYAAGIGDRTGMGERSDTVMVVRVDPTANTAAMLSLPRDLWVDIAGRGTGRLNSAFVSDDPQRLIDTIHQDFGIRIDHFVQVDLCAFKTIVDAIGGVTIPFDRPVRDRHTGLDVPAAGCVTFDGDHALAYVRSRHYETLDADGVWQEDPTGDLGRITRQQEVVRQVLAAARDLGFGDVGVARHLIEAVQDDVVVDDGLTISMMIDYFGVFGSLDPAAMTGFQIEGSPRTIAGNAVLIPSLDSPAMVAVLAAFRGETPLADAEEAAASAPIAAPSTTTPAVITAASSAPSSPSATGTC